IPVFDVSRLPPPLLPLFIIPFCPQAISLSLSSMSQPEGQPNMGHRHSLTIETNPLHLLPSNIRRFSHADQIRPGASVLSKLALNNVHLSETKEVPNEKTEETPTTEKK
ncbi:hypothetical protein PMAYCL1PPCAC_06453, partial [Pristionchus mayeri]